MSLGEWDTDGFATTWWDVAGNVAGWWDRDAIPFPAAIPPVPPKPPSPPRPPRPIVPVGGAAVIPGPAVTFLPPEWLPQNLQDECDDLCPEESSEVETVADFALMYVTTQEATPPPQGAVVKALAEGVVEIIVDAKGRISVVLTGDDGTRYWYADVGATTVADGTRVHVGQEIARTKVGAQSIPEITSVSREPLLGDGTPPEPKTEPKPAQVVFVEPLPEIKSPRRQWARLVPIDPLPPSDEETLTPVRKPVSLVRTVVTAGLFAVLIYALVSFESKSKPKPRSPKKRKKRKKRR